MVACPRAHGCHCAFGGKLHALAIAKVKVLQDFCATSAMVVNVEKTKFVVVKGDEHDRQCLVHEDFIIKIVMAMA